MEERKMEKNMRKIFLGILIIGLTVFLSGIAIAGAEVSISGVINEDGQLRLLKLLNKIQLKKREGRICPLSFTKTSKGKKK
jgi:hypothetical protein